MKTSLPNLWLTLSLLLATACGARTPLDVEPDQSTSPVGGGATSPGSGAGGTFAIYGGSFAAGGSGGMAGAGGSNRPGGTLAGGSRTGGVVPFGGAIVGGRGTVAFGGTGGTVPFGGTTYGPFGGSIIVGGRGGTAGTVPFGGSGGTVPFGGTVVGGRSTATGGTVPFGGSGGIIVGGRGGTAGSGAAGGTGAAGSSGTAGTTCQGLTPNEELIDDMNDGDRFIPQINGRAGAWTDSDDSTPGSKMFPDPAGLFAMTATGDPCRQYAAYVYGGPFVDWGADFWFGLGSPYDAALYNGIDFWAKIDAGTTSVLRVAFPDKDTYPDGGLCQTNVTGPTQCYDHYGARITLTTTWTKYTVPFSSLSQDGWGRLGSAFDPSTLYEVLFEIPVNAKFGIWIDDVAFTGYFGPTPYFP